MNTTPDSPQQPPLPAGGFFAWIRGLGIVRGSDRWFAGVAGGIAAKAKIDPLIVRGVFVVLALLGGPGILLYLVGWLLLPDFTGRIRMEDLIRGRAEGWTIVALVVVALSAIPMLLNLFTPGVFGWTMAPWGFFGLPGWLSATIAWLVWIAIIVTAWVWLHRVITGRVRAKRAEEQSGGADPATASSSASFAAPAAPAAASTPAAAASASTAHTDPLGDAANNPAGNTPGSTTGQPFDTSGFSTTPFPSTSGGWTQRIGEKAENWGERAGQWGERAGEKATQWSDQVGKQADEWSERYVEQHEARKLGAAHVVITLALALLASGATALWVNSADSFGVTGSVVPVTVVAALVAALAVFAVSIIVAGIRGRRTGWIGFLASCGVVALLFTSVLPWGTGFQPFGTVHTTGIETPGSVLIAGNSQVDLRSLDGQKPRPNDSSGTDLVVWQLAGNATVTMPEDHPTIVNVYVLAGVLGEQRGGETFNAVGPFLSKRVTANIGSDSATSAATTVSVYLLAGNVRVVSSDETSSSRDGSAPSDKTTDRSEEKLRELNDEQKLLESDLSRVEWQLEEPGLSKGDRRDLLAERTQIEKDLADLELEMAR